MKRTERWTGFTTGRWHARSCRSHSSLDISRRKYLHDLATQGEAALPKEEVVDTGVTVINSENVRSFARIWPR